MEVYREQAERYDQLVSKQPGLWSVIREIIPTQGLDVIDMGAGSGRLTTILAPYANSILATDTSPQMLKINQRKLQAAQLSNYRLQVADHRKIPAVDHGADLVIAGWSISYLGSSNVPNNEQNIEQVMQEMHRVLRKDGTIIIFETMGTGYEAPTPPIYLKRYYSLLENTYGFSYKWVRLDYDFKDLQEADALTRFFFGDALADRVVAENLVHLPECAGIWWLKK
jgi:ubiquinone/menaquinone biosynthesis C-methylase UbiE